MEKLYGKKSLGLASQPRSKQPAHPTHPIKLQKPQELQKISGKIKKVLAIKNVLIYTNNCCGMIAVKREVAADGRDEAGWRVFRGANVKLGN